MYTCLTVLLMSQLSFSLLPSFHLPFVVPSFSRSGRCPRPYAVQAHEGPRAWRLLHPHLYLRHNWKPKYALHVLYMLISPMWSEAVMITHDNVVWTSRTLVKWARLELGDQMHVVSYLPLRFYSHWLASHSQLVPKSRVC